ncbi:Cell division protein ZapB [Cedecea neteri]|uniref:Cell division protein ZapB n=1 Tax=Cedecea neteri TaxID=158822 RepID=A0A2X2SZ07_9ENTR|nr:Cell division protein ZapB [Cedecea neteri]
MSFEVFEKLEAKVQQAVDTITLLQMEIEELKEKNNGLAQEVQQAQSNHEELVRENSSLKEQQHVWQERFARAAGQNGRSVISLPTKKNGRLRRRYASHRLDYSMSSGSSERMMPVLSAYRWSPEKKVTPPKLTRTSLSPMPSPAEPAGMAAIAWMPISSSSRSST